MIQVSARKTALIFLCSICFGGIGLWMVVDSSTISETSTRSDSPAFVAGMGIIGILFFGACGVWAARKLYGNSPGLILSKEGLTDKTSAISAGFVPWSDIKAIKEHSVRGHKFVAVEVIDPDKYRKSGSFLQRILKQFNQSFYGTPIHISSHSLEISYYELLEAIRTYRAWFRSKS